MSRLVFSRGLRISCFFILTITTPFAWHYSASLQYTIQRVPSIELVGLDPGLIPRSLLSRFCVRLTSSAGLSVFYPQHQTRILHLYYIASEHYFTAAETDQPH